MFHKDRKNLTKGQSIFYTDQKFIVARFFQSLICFLLLTVLLPRLWGCFFLIITQQHYHLDFKASTIFVSIMFVYPKAALSSVFIALILAARSFTWGRVSPIFVIATTLTIALLTELIFRLPHLESFAVGYGSEPIGYWLAAWLLSASSFAVLNLLCGFDKRYTDGERQNLRDCFWILFIYFMFLPVIFTLLQLKFFQAEGVVLAAARGNLTYPLSPVAFLTSVITALVLAAKMRRSGKLPWCWLVLLPIFILLIVLISAIVTGISVDRTQLIGFFGLAIAVYFIFSTLVFGLFKIGERKPQESSWHICHDLRSRSRFQLIWFFLTGFIINLIIIPLILNFTTISLRAIFFGFPPSTMLMRDMAINWFYGGTFCAIYLILMVLTKNLTMMTSFGAGFLLCFLTWFVPLNGVGLHFGTISDNFALPMIAFLPMILSSFAVSQILAKRSFAKTQRMTTKI